LVMTGKFSMDQPLATELIALMLQVKLGNLSLKFFKFLSFIYLFLIFQFFNFFYLHFCFGLFFISYISFNPSYFIFILFILFYIFLLYFLLYFFVHKVIIINLKCLNSESNNWINISQNLIWNC